MLLIGLQIDIDKAMQLRIDLVRYRLVEHVFVLSQALALYDAYAQQLCACDAKIEQLLAGLARFDASHAKARTKVPRARLSSTCTAP